jgi:aspartyl-tRNA(Asn)/glutamyl-tRNA(Gln) amidotransferase subunit A
MDLAYLSIREAHELFKSKKVSAVQLTQYYLDRIAKYDGKVRTCLTVCAAEALAAAKQVDAKITAGQDIGLLEGIPYTAKDMFLTKGVRTTAASKILDNFIPPFSATVIEKLDAAGAIMIAKVNQDEFAHGGSTENSGFHPTHNPWDVERVPGGSSGGSAAAVAADFGIFSLGTDTGGSIRQPAAYCGVVGLKPTYGAVSRYGVVAMGSSLDCIGPLARSAEDAQLVFDAVMGRDVRDATTIELDRTRANIAKDRVFRLKNYSALDLNDDSLGDMTGFMEAMQAEGHSVDADAQDAKEKPVQDSAALAAYYILTPSEISSNLSRYDGVRFGHSSEQAHTLRETYDKTRDEGFGNEVKRRVLTGTYALSAGYYDAYYKKAMQVRTLLREQFARTFADCDILITPTTLAPAFKLGEKHDPIEMYKTDILTVSANLAGIPALSIPIGFVDGMPVGLQLMAPQGHDADLLAIASAYQKASAWHDLKQRSPQL